MHAEALVTLLLTASMVRLHFDSLLVHFQDPDPVRHRQSLVHVFGRLEPDRMLEGAEAWLLKLHGWMRFDDG